MSVRVDAIVRPSHICASQSLWVCDGEKILRYEVGDASIQRERPDTEAHIIESQVRRNLHDTTVQKSSLILTRLVEERYVVQPVNVLILINPRRQAPERVYKKV